MERIIQSFLYNILTGLYQPFWFVLILSVFFMFIWKRFSSIKEAASQWIVWFKTEALFRKNVFSSILHCEQSMEAKITNMVKVIGEELLIDKTYSANPAIHFMEQR